MSGSEQISDFIVEAFKNISNCIKHKKQFVESSIDNFLKKDTNYPKLVAEIRIRTNTPLEYIESFFSIARESKEEVIIEAAKETIETMIKNQYEIPQSLKAYWIKPDNLNSSKRFIQIASTSKSAETSEEIFHNLDESKSISENEKIQFLISAFKNIHYCARNQRKFDGSSLENFLKKNQNLELTKALDVDTNSIDFRNCWKVRK